MWKIISPFIALCFKDILAYHKTVIEIDSQCERGETILLNSYLPNYDLLTTRTEIMLGNYNYYPFSKYYNCSISVKADVLMTVRLLNTTIQVFTAF